MNDYVSIWTDGACSVQKRCGGWAAILFYQGKKVSVSGMDLDTTNNRMELTAVIEGLRRLKKPFKVKIFTDSKLIVSAFRQNWLEGWQRRGWRKADGAEVSNVDLWKSLLEMLKCKTLSYNFVWVKGHAGLPLNEAVDKLACAERDAALYRKKYT